ncbi:helix-turn-helix domain-containing protein [Kribbella sp. NPDC023855]|uniref:helix-turn-helix domain-containing protein n=1 Tax=Kribbella sp. NPDC023855 TaxID=3154698 RepID=UPI0033C7CFD2
MAKQPLPLGTWGRISSRAVSRDAKGRADKFEAKARYRDFDGRTRRVTAWGKTATGAENNLRTKLKTRTKLRGSSEIKPDDRVAVAVELFLAEVKELGEQEVMAPGTYQTYRYQYDKNLAPRIAEVRLGEVTTPRVNDVIKAIRDEVGAASARTCKSILSGALSLSVRHGALDANPVREIKIRPGTRRRPPRALEAEERDAWFELLRQDERAVRADLVDLCKFMLATGERIGEALAVTWRDINRETGEVDCSHQMQRLRGQGLVRRRVKSAAGERSLRLPKWALEMVRARWNAETPLDSPVFPDSVGGFRDPHNVQRSLRDARRPIGGQRRIELGKTLRSHRRKAGLTQVQAVSKLGWRKTRISLIETGRVRLDAKDAIALADAYRLTKGDRAALLELTELAGMRSLADEMAWVTAHVFRKTTATILEDAGQTPRRIADQLGHSRTSTTVDDYIGRRTRNPEAAGHLEDALRNLHELNQAPSANPTL